MIISSLLVPCLPELLMSPYHSIPMKMNSKWWVWHEGKLPGILGWDGELSGRVFELPVLPKEYKVSAHSTTPGLGKVCIISFCIYNITYSFCKCQLVVNYCYLLSTIDKVHKMVFQRYIYFFILKVKVTYSDSVGITIGFHSHCLWIQSIYLPSSKSNRCMVTFQPQGQ